MISLFLVEDERIARETMFLGRNTISCSWGMRRMEKSLCRSSWKNGRIFC